VDAPARTLPPTAFVSSPQTPLARSLGRRPFDPASSLTGLGGATLERQQRSAVVRAACGEEQAWNGCHARESAVPLVELMVRLSDVCCVWVLLEEGEDVSV